MAGVIRSPRAGELGLNNGPSMDAGVSWPEQAGVTASGRAALPDVAGRPFSAASAAGPAEATTLAPMATAVTPADVDLMKDRLELPCSSPPARDGGCGPLAASGLVSSA